MKIYLRNLFTNFFRNFFRKDLSLNKKWWHRLFKVLFSVSLTLFAIIVAAVIWEDNRRGMTKPSHERYYEVMWTLNDYISKNSEDSLVSLEEMIGDNAYVVNQESIDEVHEVWDFIPKPYVYLYDNWDNPGWIITDNGPDIYTLKDMQCKDWMEISDVTSYKFSHNDTEYYSRVTEKCELYPKDYSFLTDAIRINLQMIKSNCIYSENSCTFTTNKSGRIGIFFVIKETDESIKYSDYMYNKNKHSYYKDKVWLFLKTILQTILRTTIIAIILMLAYYKWIIYIIYWTSILNDIEWHSIFKDMQEKEYKEKGEKNK